MAKAIYADPLIRDIYSRLANGYFIQGNIALAMQYRERQFALEQYLLNIDRLQAVSALEIKYQTAQKEQQLAAAKIENLRKSRWIGFLIAGLLIATLGILFVQQKRQTDAIKAHQAIQKIEQAQEFERLQSFFQGEENERKRIASDLHDSLGGLLYALQLQLSFANLPKPKDTIKQAIQENRRIIKNLLPATLVKLGLNEALQEWIPEFETNWNIPVHQNITLPSRLPANIEISTFRILQELLNNVAKHAQATAIYLTLQLADNQLQLTVQDDGKGIDLKNVSPTFLKTVASRVSLLEGKYEVESSINKGTLVKVAIKI